MYTCYTNKAINSNELKFMQSRYIQKYVNVIKEYVWVVNVDVK